MNTASVIPTATVVQLKDDWQDICAIEDLVPYSGIGALVAGVQAAIFYVPDAEPAVYVLDNWCPAAHANVLSRGIVGDINGELVVASPLYKEHFRLTDGQCIEKPLQVSVWPVRIEGDRVKVRQLSINKPD